MEAAGNAPPIIDIDYEVNAPEPVYRQPASPPPKRARRPRLFLLRPDGWGVVALVLIVLQNLSIDWAHDSLDHPDPHTAEARWILWAGLAAGAVAATLGALQVWVPWKRRIPVIIGGVVGIQLGFVLNSTIVFEQETWSLFYESAMKPVHSTPFSFLAPALLILGLPFVLLGLPPARPTRGGQDLGRAAIAVGVAAWMSATVVATYMLISMDRLAAAARKAHEPRETPGLEFLFVLVVLGALALGWRRKGHVR